MTRTSRTALLCAVAVAVATTALPASAADGPKTISSGFNMPLTLDVGHKRTAYVTAGNELIRVSSDGRQKVLRSIEGELTGVAVDGKNVYHIENGADGSHLVRTDHRGRTKVVSNDFWEYETKRNPDAKLTYGIVGLDAECKALVEEGLPEPVPGEPAPLVLEYKGIVESHAYQTEISGRTAYVADAAANAVFAVDLRSKRISTVAVLPPVPVTITEEVVAGVASFGLQLPDCVLGHTWYAESVPTDVAKGHDGMLYVTTLGGAIGEMLPLSAVYKVDPRKGKVHVVAKELFGATGLDVKGKDIYVAEMFASQVSVIRKGKAKPLFSLDQAADVVVAGKHVLATGGVFPPGNGVLVGYRR